MSKLYLKLTYASKSGQNFISFLCLLKNFTKWIYRLLHANSSFSYGIFSNEGPSDERQEATISNLKLHGKGWSEKVKDPIRQPDSPPDKEIIGKVFGRNPGYGLTCAALALSAIMILTEADKIPDRGGVYPPGVAFAKTSIIEKLQENGVKFELLSKK